jgi:AAA ATPase domain
VLVGRAEELAALDAAFEPVREGRPSTVLIGGEAGIGKSRLASEFGARARAAAAARVLSGYCLELSAEGLPFAPFTGILRDLVRDLGADAVAAMVPGQGAGELARLLPELGEPGVLADPAEARGRMFEQVLALFEHLAESGPLVVVIEDAHWSDRSTRDLLAFLVGNQRALDGVLIVVTFRSDELHRGHPLRPLLAELDRLDWVQRLALRGLARRQAGELMARVLGSMKRRLGHGEGIDDLREALRLVPPDSPGPARGRVLGWLAAWLGVSARPGARAAAEEALHASRQAGDGATEAHALITLAGLNFREHGDMSVDLLEQARALGEKAQVQRVLLRAATYESHVLEGVGEHERAAQAARQGMARARDYGLARVAGTVLAALAEPLVSLGRWDEAAEVIGHAWSCPRRGAYALCCCSSLVR